MRFLSKWGKHVLQTQLCAGSFLWRLPAGSDCALTFDDGPHREHTPRLLDLLGTHRIKATFFVVGTAAAQEPALLRRIAGEGHAIGSHTFSHRDFPTLSRAELWQELTSCREVINSVTDTDTMLVRPPRGRVNAASLIRIKSWGYKLVHWTKTYSDYLCDGRDALLHRIHAGGLEPRDIALFHDTNSYTIEALAQMLPVWHNRGRSFTTL